MKRRDGWRMNKIGEWRKRGRICWTPCLLWGILLLTGCQLAREEKDFAGADRLCGVLVTTEDQEEAWRALSGSDQEDSAALELTDRQIRQLLSGETQILSPMSKSGPKVEGSLGEDREYSFEGLEGASFLAGMDQEDENGSYTYYTASGVFQELHYNTNTSDEGETSHSEGTIYVGKKADLVLHISPVYQRQDGSVYALLNSTAGYWNSGQNSPGAVYSQSIKEENSQTISGKTKTQAREFTVHIAVGEEIRSARVKEWSGEDVLLRVTGISRGQERFKLQEDTAYMVVEEEKADGSVKRSIYTWDSKKGSGGELVHSLAYENQYGLLEAEILQFEK